MEYLQSIYWAPTFRGQKIMNQVLYDCDRYKTARCSCSMQPIINWTQWKWSRQFSGRRNLSNCKSIPAPHRHKPLLDQQLELKEMQARSPEGNFKRKYYHNWFLAREELCSGHDLSPVHHKHHNQCYICVVFGPSLSTMTRYKGMSKIKYKVMSGPSWTFIKHGLQICQSF